MPSPTTTGGGLMGYPITVDAGGVSPSALITPDITVIAGNVITAGQAYFTEYLLNASVTVAQMRCWLTGAPTGNIDMGIYDATGTNGGPGNLLGHTGANLSSAGLFTKNLTANLMLSPGKYWLAWVDTVADAPGCRFSLSAGIGVQFQTTATNLTVLPSTSGAIADSTVRMGMMALLSGSFS